MNKSSQYILITEYKTNAANWKDIAIHVKRAYDKKNDYEHAVYVAHDESAVIEIISLSQLSEIDNVLKVSNRILNEIKFKLLTDIRRQVLTLIEAVKDQNQLVPTTRYLQLRHIEVPLAVYDDYIKWREQTIFKHVRNQSVISSFVAYHSLISTEPGIMFLSCFDDNISEYQAGFESPEYKQIIKEAGTNFIAGGERGLYTTIYEQYHE
jgi:hypothetical protein